MAVKTIIPSGSKANSDPQNGAKTNTPGGQTYIQLSSPVFNSNAEGETRQIKNHGYWVKKVGTDI
jgi:hypothetical protein|tara:strand:- start:709 stop:903 length:195 start_codon:yes stop_codon:yes gene_type:complete